MREACKNSKEYPDRYILLEVEMVSPKCVGCEDAAIEVDDEDFDLIVSYRAKD